MLSRVVEVVELIWNERRMGINARTGLFIFIINIHLAVLDAMQVGITTAVVGAGELVTAWMCSVGEGRGERSDTPPPTYLPHAPPTTIAWV